jgi:hypothetical protein
MNSIHRGFHEPTKHMVGIDIFQLIKFLEQAEKNLEQENETDAAFRISCMVDFFKQDYKEGKSLVYKAAAIGL